MSTIFFLSDPHFGHKLVSGLRGFDTTDSHDDALIKNWHATISPEDTVWVLGDLACSGKDEVILRALDIVSRLPGKKHLVSGNHDPVHSMHKNAWKYQGTYLEVFESVQTFAKIRVQSTNVLLSHFPYTADHTSDVRYAQWRLPDLGAYLLHGHTHSASRVGGPRELHVGLDAWDLKPVQLKTVEAFVSGFDVTAL